MGMKFRCERDTLLDALMVAGASRSWRQFESRCPDGCCISSWTDGVLTVTGSDLDLTLSVTAEVLGTAGGAAVTCRPACSTDGGQSCAGWGRGVLGG